MQDASFEWHEPGRIDWRQPWLAPLARWGEPALAAIAAGASVATACNGLRGIDGLTPGRAPRCVPADVLPAGEAYEAFIARTGQVPTRDNPHDFFNALMWLHRPVQKARLNALQAAEIVRYGVAAQRGALRDALTLFDESGAMLQAPANLVDALRRRDWRSLFVTHRADWRQAQFEVFGHALLEKLALAPRKALTAHVLVGEPLDLSPQDWAAKPFCPLPVLGLPGWWPANDDPAFYDDAAVFRPPSASITR